MSSVFSSSVYRSAWPWLCLFGEEAPAHAHLQPVVQVGFGAEIMAVGIPLWDEMRLRCSNDKGISLGSACGCGDASCKLMTVCFGCTSVIFSHFLFFLFFLLLLEEAVWSNDDGSCEYRVSSFSPRTMSLSCDSIAFTLTLSLTDCFLCRVGAKEQQKASENKANLFLLLWASRLGLGNWPIYVLLLLCKFIFKCVEKHKCYLQN